MIMIKMVMMIRLPEPVRGAQLAVMATHRRYHRYPRATVMTLVVVLLLLSSFAYADTLDAEPDHGLTQETTEASPAMTAFFQGSGAQALPEAASGRNGTSGDPIWDLAGQAARADAGTLATGPVDGSGRGNGAARKVLLAAGITFGLLGLGFLGGAAFVYVKHSRRTASARAAAKEDGRFHHLELL